MERRNSRKQIAEQTLKELDQGYYLDSHGRTISIKEAVQQSVESSHLLLRADLESLLVSRKRQRSSYDITVARNSTLQCLIEVHSDAKKIALLNFASAKNPGGGFMGGSQAQEESLARSSSLYPALTRNKQFYDTNRAATDTFYRDNLIYSPQVVFFKNDEGLCLDHFIKADVITAPAVNKGALQFINREVQKEIDDTMKRRMRYVLAVSEKNDVDLLILGAWGCGVFKNDPQDIANNFCSVLKEEPKFDIPKLVFAILDRDGKAFNAFEPLSKI